MGMGVSRVCSVWYWGCEDERDGGIQATQCLLGGGRRCMLLAWVGASSHGPIKPSAAINFAPPGCKARVQIMYGPDIAECTDRP